MMLLVLLVAAICPPPGSTDERAIAEYLEEFLPDEKAKRAHRQSSRA